MILDGEPVELDVRDLALADLPEMNLWVSSRLYWVAAPAKQYPVDIGVGGVIYRRLDPVWLSWLRAHAYDGLDGASLRAVSVRAEVLKQAMSVYVPQAVGSAAEVPDGYQPPVLDSVSYARS